MSDDMGFEVFPPGEFLVDELAARDWSIQEFADIIGRPFQVVSDIIHVRRRVTPDTARAIGAAFGTSAQMWLNAQQAYDLWKSEQEPGADDHYREIARRGELHKFVAVRELEKRGVLTRELPALVAESQLLDLLAVDSLSDPMPVAARRSNQDEDYSPKQMAWLACVRFQSRGAMSVPFDLDGVQRLAASLTQEVTDPRALQALPERFAAVGLRLVYEPQISGGKMQGVSFFDEQTPVVALSGQRSRFDMVLFTLLHELAHIAEGHVTPGSGYLLDETVFGESNWENDANELAGRWALPGWRVPPKPWSRVKVGIIAAEMGVHPSIVVGRLQSQHGLSWTHLNGLCVKNVRSDLETWRG